MLSRHLRIICVLLGWVLSYGLATAQCPQASFTLPDTVCINEPLTLTNTSTGATRYEWDFCSGDLEKTPAVNLQTTLPAAHIPTDISMVMDGTNWYGFVSSRDNHQLFRLDFGSSPDNTPAITALGNPGGVLESPEQMKFIKESGNWYALVVFNYTNQLARLSFGSSLTNVPVIEKITSLTGLLKQPRGIEIAYDGGELITLVTNYKNNSILLINFGSSITNNPASVNTIATNSLPGAVDGLVGISVAKRCDQWIGVATSYSNRMYTMDFGKTLFAIPTVNDISSLYKFPAGLGRTVLTAQDDNYYAFVILFNGDLLRYDFKNGFPGNVSVQKTASFTGDGFGIELVKQASAVRIFSVDFFSKKIFQFSFPDQCTASTPVSSVTTPAGISYLQGGWKKVSLLAKDNSGSSSIYADSVFVRPEVAATFSVSKQCEGTATGFTAASASSGNRVINYSWNFGDGSTASGSFAEHTYAGPGTYTVTLTIQDICNRTSTSSKQVTIYKNTIPDFPAPAPFCSNQPVSFTDASTVFDDTPVSWQWNLGNGATVTGKNPIYTYPQGGNYTVTLTVTGTSGCSVSVAKPVSVKAGAAADFSISQECLGFQTQFTDKTIIPEATTLVSRQWEFGDGTTSTDPDPVHTYAATGSYTVKFTIENNTGCITSQVKTVTIRRPPVAAFSFALPCTGEATSFTDESTANDGSVRSWLWDFGDLSSFAANTSTGQHPSHIYSRAGTYIVKLKVFSQYGCVDSLTKMVNVLPAPRSDFNAQVNCQTREVTFNTILSADNSTAIQGWYWDFGDGSSSTDQHPKHTYKQNGTFTVVLTATDGNRCANAIQKIIQVTGPPVADFAFTLPSCAGSPITFSDQSTAGNSQITSWQWDFGPAGSATVRNPVVTFPAETTRVPVFLTVTTAAGCTNTVSKTVTLQPAPQAQFTFQPAYSLNPFAVSFSSTSSTDAVRHQWNFGDGQIADSRNPVHTFTASGVYNVSLTVTNAAGCAKTATQEVTVSAVPNQYQLKLEGILVNYPSGKQPLIRIKLFNRSSLPITQLAFHTIIDQWHHFQANWQGTLNAGALLEYEFVVPGQLSGGPFNSVCVQATDEIRNKTSNRECTTAEDIFTVFSPHPNPASQSVTLSFATPQTGSVAIEILDALGRQVEHFSIPLVKSGFNEAIIPVSTLRKSVYFVRFSYNGQTHIERLLVQ